jgi:methionine salvage enolase-phosphatase E1
VIKYDIDSAKRNGYLPISLGKKTENSYLYDILINRRQVTNEVIFISDQTGSGP